MHVIAGFTNLLRFGPILFLPQGSPLPFILSLACRCHQRANSGLTAEEGNTIVQKPFLFPFASCLLFSPALQVP